MKCNNKFNLKKIIFFGIILLSVILVVPFLAKLLEGIEFLGFTQGELLGYGGVLIGGAITFIVLKITNKTNNESLNKQIETQKDIMMKQFEFGLKEKQVKDLEVELKNILNKCRISEETISSFNQIPKYLSKNTFEIMRSSFGNPLMNFRDSIEKLTIITSFEIDNFQLVIDSFIIDDVILNNDYMVHKSTIMQYLNEYIISLRNLNNTINDIIYLISEICNREQDNNLNNVAPEHGKIIKYNPIFENEISKFSILKSNLDYYIGSHNTFKIMGWNNISGEIGKFIKFLNKYILISDNTDRGKINE